MGARDRANAERAAKELDALPLLLDVTDEALVRAAADRVAAEQGRLDVLVNNAGIGGVRKPVGEITGDDLAHVFDTNVVGIVVHRVESGGVDAHRAVRQGVSDLRINVVDPGYTATDLDGDRGRADRDLRRSDRQRAVVTTA